MDRHYCRAVDGFDSAPEAQPAADPNLAVGPIPVADSILAAVPSQETELEESQDIAAAAAAPDKVVVVPSIACHSME